MSNYLKPETRMQCIACGEIWDITRVANTTALPVKFCPACSYPLAPHVSSFDALSAPVFTSTGATRELIAYLYQDWRQSLSDRTPILIFRDYLAARLRAACATLTPTPDRDK